MTRTAAPSRTHLLTDALESVGKTSEQLKKIDLRTVRGPLKGTLKKAREDSLALEVELRKAIREDGESLRQAG